MITIRKGVFETNSSSTHSIVIAREGTQPSDEIEFRIGEYGWENRELWGPNEKASYIYTLACDALCRDVADDFAKLLSPFGINCKFTLKPVFENGYLRNGYVDHADDGIDLVNDCLSDGSLLLDLIFNDKSNVVTGNDNNEYKESYYVTPDCESKTYFKGN